MIETVNLVFEKVKLIVNNHGNLLFLIISSLIYFIRLLYLDADSRGSWLITGIHGDEIYYNEIGINIFQSGLDGLLSGSWADVALANCKNFLLPNFLTGLSFDVFGLTFYGLRIPYVILGFLTFLLVYWCAKKCFPASKMLIYGIPIIYLFDVSILLSTRYALTVTPCMFAAVLLFAGYIFLKNKRKLCYFFLGIIPTIVFCCVYNYMAFLLLAGFLFILIDLIRLKIDLVNKIKVFIWYIGGIITGVLVSELLSLVCFKSHIFSILLDVLIAHSGKISTIGSSIINTIKGYTYNFLSYPSANLFRYDYLVLILFVFTLMIIVFFVFSCIKKREKLINTLNIIPNEAYFIFIVVVCHIIQIIFLNNLTMTKTTITAPFIMLFIGFGLYFWIHKLSPELSRKSKTFLLIIMSILSLVCVLGLTCVYLRYTYLPPSVIVLLTCGNIVLSILILLYLFRLPSKKLGLIILTIGVGIMASFSIGYVYVDNTFQDVNICNDIYSVVGSTPVVGGHSKMYYLYDGGNMDVLVGEYDHYHGVGYDMSYVHNFIKDSVYKYDDLFYLGLASGVGIEEMDINYINNNTLSTTPYQFVLYKEYLRERGGERGDYAIYKKILKEAFD